LVQKIVSLGCGSGKARLHIALLSELFVLFSALRSLGHSLQCVWNQLVPVPHTRKARELGFSLEDTRALLALRGPDNECADVKAIARCWRQTDKGGGSATVARIS
jgi:hypothetical protein